MAAATRRTMRVLMLQSRPGLTPARHRGLAAEGFVLTVAHDRAQAQSLARDNTYDIVVLDDSTPRMDGYRLCQSLRAGGVWTPVLILAAAEGTPGRDDVFDVRADDYLTMPITFVELTARLRDLIRRSLPQRPVVLRAGDLSLDPFARTAERAGIRLELTSREFALLHFLIRHRGSVLTKTQILTEVWDAPQVFRPNIVEVYISYLRKKIDRPFGRETILTVRGLGYRLVE